VKRLNKFHCIFLNYEDHLKTLRSNREVTVNSYFEELQEMDFRDGIKALEHRWMKCIKVGGDHIEK